MHPLIFFFSWIIAGIILVTSFSVSNTHFLPLNIAFNDLSKPVRKQIECLAENIYFEAAHESRDGKVAVALVTLNRVTTGNYAKDVCSVVYQKTRSADNKTICQFSWTCDGKLLNQRLTVKHSSLYNEIRELSIHVFMNYEQMKDITKGATYYHADYIVPGWNLAKTIKIGRHIFYKKSTDIENLNRNT